MEPNGSIIENWAELARAAEAAESTEDWGSAAATYERLVSKCPDQVHLKYKLARAWAELGRRHDVINILSDPSLAGLEKTKRMLASTYIEARDYGAAAPLVNELIAASPGNPKLASWKAICEAETTDGGSLVARLKLGDELFSADRLDEAERIFIEIKDQHPGSRRASFVLGQIYMRQRRWKEAVSAFRSGLAAHPDDVKARRSLAWALFKSRQPAEAIAALDGLDVRNDRDLLILKQRCHTDLKHWRRAEEAGARLLAILSPEDPVRGSVSSMRRRASIELALQEVDAIAASGDIGRAIGGYREITTAYPDCAVAWFKLGTVLERDQKNIDATSAFTKAFDLSSGDMKFRAALTRVVVKTCEDREILRYVEDAINAGSADFECHRWLARYHAKLYDWPATLSSVQNALAIKPGDAPCRILMVRALMHLGRLPEALALLDQIGLEPARRVEVLQLKADIFVRLARIDDAIELYRKALRDARNHPLISARLSYAYLLKGDIAGFHRFHEKRRLNKSFIANNKSYPFRDWNGELSIEGKLLVWSEFGLGVGQNILHMAFLRQLASLGLDVVFEVEPRLVKLCRRSFPEIAIVANDAALPSGISHHTPVGSLSRWFKPDLASFDTTRPYFVPDVEAVAAHRDRLQRAAGQGKLLIGVSWTSNNPFVGDVKSVPLDQLIDALGLPDVALVDLQYGDHSQAIALAEERTGKRLIDSGIDNSNDLDGLAAVIAAMDLVVCIGHTTAHVAGALGTPNFVLLPSAPFAHWLAHGERCIWYPNTTLFRQAPIDHGWGAVLECVRDFVRNFAESYDSACWLVDTLVPRLKVPSTEARTITPREIRDAVTCFTEQEAFRSALHLLNRLPAEQFSRDLDIKRADLLARVGKWNEANAVYSSIDPVRDCRELDRQILSMSLAIHDLDCALPIARELAEDDPAYRLTLANILYHQRRNGEALTELRAASLEAPQLEGLSRLLGTLLLERREFELAESYLRAQTAMKKRPEDYTLLGRSIWAQGRHEEALGAYDKAIALKKYDPGANFWRTQGRVELGLVSTVPLPPLLGDLPNATREDLVFFFVADNSYFWEHALVLLGSIGRSSPTAMCHVHVINPDEGVARAIEVIRNLLPDLALSYSCEHIDFEGCNAVHVRTYYASVRFVRLAELFAQKPAFYVCVDADCIVRGDIAAEVAGLDLADVGIRMRYDDRPQFTVAAGALMLRPTSGAAKFIDRVSALIRRTLEAREAVWFLDQIALSHVLCELADSDVEVSQLDMTYIDWFFHDHSLIWTGKGNRKSEDSRYTRELSHYRYIQEHAQIRSLMHSGNEEASTEHHSLLRATLSAPACGTVRISFRNQDVDSTQDHPRQRSRPYAP